MDRTRGLFSLDGKVAVVTGASRGIGAAIAQGLAAHGAAVVVSSRRQEAVDVVAEEVRDAGGEATAVACHMGEAADIDALVEASVARYGGVDILVNNAATNPVFGSVHKSDAGVFDKVMDVNLRGPFELCKRVHPLMKARGGGAIINVSSINGLKPELGNALYGTSKAALINLSQALAKEWGPDGVRVNVVCPGLIQTKFSRALWTDEQVMAAVRNQLPLRRIGQPEELAGLAVFLASDASSYCTGGVYLADGGFLLM